MTYVVCDRDGWQRGPEFDSLVEASHAWNFCRLDFPFDGPFKILRVEEPASCDQGTADP